MSKTLDAPLHRKISLLSERGNEAMDRDRFGDALKCFEGAWMLLPEPREHWEAATWLLAGMGDAHFMQGHFEEARDAFVRAVRAPGGLGNPFIHLRLGQTALELRDEQRAGDELARAFMGGGEEIFAGEDEKYWRFIGPRLRKSTPS